MWNLIRILIISQLFFLTNQLIAQHDICMKSFVDGVIVTPFYTGSTLPKNQLQLSTSLFYYRHTSSQENILYYPFNIKNINEDVLLNYSIHYGITDKTEIAVFIPVAPDWHPNYGSNRNGIADITLFLKYNTLKYRSIKNGIVIASKLNTSTFPNVLNWYGTSNNNIFLTYIASITKNNFDSFLNVGYKYILGETERPSVDSYSAYQYSNTILAAVGIRYQFLNRMQAILESNYESSNKKHIDGYYLDFCMSVYMAIRNNFQLFIKSGKNLNNFTPFFHLTSGFSMQFSL